MDDFCMNNVFQKDISVLGGIPSQIESEEVILVALSVPLLLLLLPAPGLLLLEHKVIILVTPPLAVPDQLVQIHLLILQLVDPCVSQVELIALVLDRLGLLLPHELVREVLGVGVDVASFLLGLQVDSLLLDSSLPLFGLEGRFGGRRWGSLLLGWGGRSRVERVRGLGLFGAVGEVPQPGRGVGLHCCGFIFERLRRLVRGGLIQGRLVLVAWRGIFETILLLFWLADLADLPCFHILLDRRVVS